MASSTGDQLKIYGYVHSGFCGLITNTAELLSVNEFPENPNGNISVATIRGVVKTNRKRLQDIPVHAKIVRTDHDLASILIVDQKNRVLLHHKDIESVPLMLFQSDTRILDAQFSRIPKGIMVLLESGEIHFFDQTGSSEPIPPS